MSAVHAVGIVDETGQDLGDVLEGAALQQPGQQQVPFLPECELLVEVHCLLAGEQTTGLQFHQGRGNQQEFGGDVQVEFLHLGQLGQIRIHDRRQADLVDVHLLLHDEVEKQVERALIDRGRHFDCHGSMVVRRLLERTNPPLLTTGN